MILPQDEIHIWRNKLNIPITVIKEYERILSLDELQRANRFKFERDKIHYISSRGIFRKILSRYLNLNPPELIFSYEEKGKPFLKNNQLKFNISHTNGYAVYVFTMNNEVGVDVEYMRDIPDMIHISKRFFSEKERNELLKIEKDKLKLAFFNCWTRKEAFIKAIGDGLSHPLESFSVTLKPEEEPKIYWIKGKSEEINFWTLYKVDVQENYVSALAIKAKDKKIVYVHEE